MIEEDTLREDFSPEEAEEVTDAICDAVCDDKTIYIDGDSVTPEACKEALFKLSRQDVTKILDTVRLRKDIRNRKHYVLAIKTFLPENAMQLWMRCNCCSLPCAVES